MAEKQKKTKLSNIALKTLSCTLLQSQEVVRPLPEMKKRADLRLKTLFCTNPCTLLKNS